MEKEKGLFKEDWEEIKGLAKSKQNLGDIASSTGSD